VIDALQRSQATRMKNDKFSLMMFPLLYSE